ncbi:MAG: VWA domain-containing protein [Candidatus Sericytochromatia bacterium]|nr:VWA domain-containing protein [Candidatus Sericytochromatia bacterium]
MSNNSNYLKIKKRSMFLFSLAFLSLNVFYNKPVFADGFIIPHRQKIIRPITEIPNFSVKNHFVNVDINDQFAKTTVKQIFKNDYNMDLEGTYFFPIPAEASISNFFMYMGEQKVKGKIYSKEEARKIYEDIVRKRRDPALLEYFNDGFFKASIFPIPANGQAKTELQYQQLNKANSNIFKYVYTLNTEKLSNTPLEEVSINVKIKTSKPLKSIYSPTHEIKINRINDNQAQVTYKVKNTKPNSEFILYYTVSEKDIDVNLLTYHDEIETKGYFLLMASPKFNVTNKDIAPKNIVFIIDKSGSMSGEKIDQAKDALKFCIKNLNKKDDFNIVSFSDNVESLSQELSSVNESNTKKALKFADGIEAEGGTNIDSALNTGLDFVNNSKKPATILFMTDGEPTVGIQNTEQILKNVKTYNPNKSKIFTFGVGFDVNTQFLDKISQQNHGDSEFVRPEENIESTVSNLFNKINMPVLNDINIKYSGINASDMYPKELPDLFKGSQLVILGRYTDGSRATVKISGKVGNQNKTFEYPLNFNKSENTDYLPKLWATRKIGFLLDEIRLKGSNKELVDEIIKLSKKYGIITEFTSFLVKEDTNLSAPSSTYRDSVKKKMGLAKNSSAGSWAISQSRNASKLKNQANQDSTSYLNESGETVRLDNQIQNIANKTFYQQKNIWVDGDFKDLKVIKIKVFSPAYFELSKINSINKYLSVGNDISVNIKGINIQIGRIGKENLTNAEKALLGIK